MTEISEAMSSAFSRILEAVTASGEAPAGPPLARYLSMGEPVITFECAIPVASPFRGRGDIKPSTVGGGDAAVTTHVGPYDTLAETWQALMAWVEAQGRAPAGPGWESYLTDPGEERDPSRWLTEICLPVS